MRGQLSGCFGPKKIGQKFAAALIVLLEAAEYASDTKSDRWDFAVAIWDLRELGLNDNDFRFLVKKQWVEHAREVTVQGTNGREFRPAGDLTFNRRTCFILTDTGIAQAQDLADDCPQAVAPLLIPDSANSFLLRHEMPCWHAETRELWIGDKLAKRFKRHAENQEIILNAFQEEGWPARIDDPLPPQPEQDSKRR